MDLPAQLVAEHRCDHRPEPILQVVPGELVRRRDESGVLDQPDGPGQTDPGLVVGANRVVVEAGNCACPDTSQVGTVVHFAVSTPTRLPPTVDTISRSLATSHVRCESNCRSKYGCPQPCPQPVHVPRQAMGRTQ